LEVRKKILTSKGSRSPKVKKYEEGLLSGKRKKKTKKGGREERKIPKVLLVWNKKFQGLLREGGTREETEMRGVWSRWGFRQ